jgi:hypothetical protein
MSVISRCAVVDLPRASSRLSLACAYEARSGCGSYTVPFALAFPLVTA